MSTSFSCMIVDDERPAREELRDLVVGYPQITLLAMCGNAAQALEQVEALRPDVLLLDINMPGLSGFDVLERLAYLPLVVFCTAYNDHAIRAFEENALDYLLKPITPERFHKTVLRIEQSLLGVGQTGALGRKLFIRDGKRIFYVAPNEIFLIEACGNYVKYHFGNQSATVRKTFRETEAYFAPLGFVAVNRSQLVNRAFMADSHEKKGRQITVLLTNGWRLEASRGKSGLLQGNGG
jgi:two-component system, LytTR family, response regulator